MKVSKKEEIKRQIKNILSKEQEIQKIIVFGTFISSEAPDDFDIAAFQNPNRGSYI